MLVANILRISHNVYNWVKKVGKKIGGFKTVNNDNTVGDVSNNTNISNSHNVNVDNSITQNKKPTDFQEKADILKEVSKLKENLIECKDNARFHRCYKEEDKFKSLLTNIGISISLLKNKYPDLCELANSAKNDLFSLEVTETTYGLLKENLGRKIQSFPNYEEICKKRSTLIEKVDEDFSKLDKCFSNINKI